MSRLDYRVINWHVDDGFDLQALRHSYRVGGHNGVSLRIANAHRLANVEFIDDFPGLEFIEVMGRVSDDSHVFEVDGVREVVLLTRCRKAIPPHVVPSLEAVGVDCRPGLGHLSSLPGLATLQIWNFRDADLTCLPESRSTSTLRIEAGNQEISLSGIESLPALAELEILQARVASLNPLRNLSKLRRLWLIGDTAGASERTLVLDDLPRHSLEELRLTYQGSIVSLSAVVDFPRLRDLRLRGTSIADENLDPLVALSERAEVVGPAD